MPRPTKGPRLGGGPAHERLMLANLATALFTHGSIKTTETKAKRLRPLAERMVTFAKRGDLHSRRKVMTVVRDKSAVHKLFMEIAPQLSDRSGGYTRVTKTGFRKGDNASMAVIELVLEPVNPKPKMKSSKPAVQAVSEVAVTSDNVTSESLEDIENGESVSEGSEGALTSEDKAEDKAKDKAKDKAEDKAKDKAEDKAKDKAEDKAKDKDKAEDKDKAKDKAKDKGESAPTDKAK